MVAGKRESKKPERLVDAVVPEAAKKAKKSGTKKAITKKSGAKKEKKTGPKRPPSAFIRFSSDHRAAIQKKNPGITFGEMGKALGEAWANCSAAEKKKYQDAADKDKKAFDKANK